MFKHLGARAEADGQEAQSLDIKSRKAQAQEKRNQLPNIWGTAKLPTRAKLRIYRAVKVSAPTYESEVWELTDASMRALNGWSVNKKKSSKPLLHLTDDL